MKQGKGVLKKHLIVQGYGHETYAVEIDIAVLTFPHYKFRINQLVGTCLSICKFLPIPLFLLYLM